MAQNGTVNGSDVRCRKSPNLSSDTWGYFQKGNRIPIWPVDYAPDWWETRWPLGGTNRGYVHKSLVDVDGGGGDTGGGSTIPGVVGNGPNSTISAAMIRAGNGFWRKDLKTTHPQIRVVQNYVNRFAANFNDVGQIAEDGIYGDNTVYLVSFYQSWCHPPIHSDGLVGSSTLSRLESQYGQIN